MSTNLRHGLILRNATLERALITLQGIRPGCQDAARRVVARRIAGDLVFASDLAMNIGMLSNEGIHTDFWSLRTEFKAAKTDVLVNGTRNLKWDATLEVSLIPHGQDVLTLFFSESGYRYRQVLLEAGFEDFHYQDSTDKPAEIDDGEWADREAIWSATFANWQTPAQIGVTYQMVGWTDIEGTLLDPLLVSRCLPEEAERRSRVAQELTEIEVTSNHPDMKPMAAVRLIDRLALERAAEVTLCPTPFA